MFIVEKDPDDKYYDKIFELKVGDNEYSFNAETKELYVDECYTADDWTDEDAWDAMTDGQYGDYPGSGWDMEMFGH